jgi:hypothetical protein
MTSVQITSKDGKILVQVVPGSSWFWAAGILDPETGRVQIIKVGHVIRELDTGRQDCLGCADAAMESVTIQPGALKNLCLPGPRKGTSMESAECRSACFPSALVDRPQALPTRNQACGPQTAFWELLLRQIGNDVEQYRLLRGILPQPRVVQPISNTHVPFS